MNSLIAAAVRCSLMFLFPALVCADSAQWIPIPFQATGMRLPIGREWLFPMGRLIATFTLFEHEPMSPSRRRPNQSHR